MDTATQILVIITSSVLTVFLIIFIIALVYVLKILKIVKRITERAESAMDSVEAAAATFERSASPVAIIKIIGNIVDQALKVRKKKG